MIPFWTWTCTLGLRFAATFSIIRVGEEEEESPVAGEDADIREDTHRQGREQRHHRQLSSPKSKTN